MSTAARITALFVAIATVFALLVTAFLAQRDYHRTLDAIVAEAPERVRSHPQVQLHIYNEREFMLDQFLAGYLDNEAVAVALAYNPKGRELGREAQIESAYYNPPDLGTVREPLSVAETGLVVVGDNGDQRSTGFWSSVFSMHERIHLTTPVFSPINPARPNLTEKDFTSAWAQPLGNGSKMVMGYVHLVLDRGALLQSARTAVLRTFIGYTLFTLLTALGLYLMLARLTAPVERLSDFAQALRAGESLDPLPVEGNAPIREITKALNDMADRGGRNAEEIGTERKLLQMKAERSASELTAREKALDEANAQIDAAKEQLHRLANYDRLTSLPNQRLFEEQLGLLLRLSVRENKPLALLNISIDGFARINESLGRMAGDYVLKVVGKRLQHCLRSSDTVALTADTDQSLNISRFNGDEFAVLLSQLSKVEQSKLVAERIIKALSKPMLVEGHEVAVQPNIGIAGAPMDGSTTGDLLDAAATALNTARSDTEQTILFYDANMAASKRVEIELESALRKAIDNNELTLHYQPQVDTGDGSIICAEALLRWEHPKFGDVSPFKFIPIAERTGMMKPLGDWVLQAACRQIKDFMASGLELPRIAINISPQQVNGDFIAQVKSTLKREGLPPETLELGIAEGVLVASDMKTHSFLRELKKIGVYLSLENFGTTHSPLGYLARHPFDDLKIDRSFVAECHKRPEAEKMVTAIVAMAESLGLRPVAEGVETESEYRFLAEQGVRVMRGFLFSRPVPPAELQRQLVVPWHYMGQVQRMSLGANIGEPS